MANYNFNLRDAKAKDKTPVNFVIRWNGNRLVLPSGLSIKPRDWESNKGAGVRYQKAKKSHKGHAEFNSYLKTLEINAEKVFNKLLSDNSRQPSVSEFKAEYERFTGKTNSTKLDLFGYFEKFIQESALKTNDQTKRTYSASTIGTYKTALKHLREFAGKTKSKLNFDSITLDFYYDYSTYLEKTKGFGLNNRGKQIKILKTVLNEATEAGLNANLAFKSRRFKVVSEEAENIYLNDSELQDLYNLNLTGNNRLERIRDLFYVGCVTGLRFSDLSKVKLADIEGNFLRVKTKKTGEAVTIPLKAEVFEILKRYGGNFPPAISNQKMNDYLKEVAHLVPSLTQKVEITKNKNGLKVTSKIEKFKLVSTHTARRSFATNCYKTGMPSFIIMKITGHRTEKSFLKYIKMNSDEHAQIMEMYMTQTLTKVK